MNQESESVKEVVKRGNTNSLDPKPQWELTLFNYTERDIEWLRSLEVKKITISKEICPSTGNPHLQGQITFLRNYRLNALKKLHPTASWRPTKAGQDSNYARKVDSEVIIDIDNRKQGYRSDLMTLKQDIIDGNYSVSEIVINNPMAYHQYGRTMEKIEDVANRSKNRTEMTLCDWCYGPTGTGKSHYAFDGYNEKTHFLWTNDNGWWDGYQGQDIVIMNDYRGEIPYNTLLQLIDKYPMKVKRRNREPMPFTSKKIIITSSLHPKKIYCHRDDEDSIEQLMRRINLIEFKYI